MTTTTPRRQMTPEQVFPATEDSSFMTRTTPWARRRRKAGKRPPRTLLPFRKMPPIRLLLEDYTVVAALPFHRIPKRLRRPLFGTLALSRINCRIQLDQMDTLAAITNQRFCRRLASGTRRLPVVGSAGRRRVPEADDGEALVCNRGESSRVHMIKSNPAAYSILPNRLGKMLAPLHWHDYKKKYGKLDDFVAAHTEVDHVPSVPIGPSSLLGMPPFLPPGQVTGMHPYVMHQPAVPHSMPPQVPQSHVGNFHSIPAMSSLQQWQNQQAPSESLQIATQTEPPSSQNDQNLIRSDAEYHCETSVNGQPFHQDYLDVQIREGAEPEPVISSSPEEAQVLESINSSYLVSPQTDQSLQQMSSQFTDSLRLDSLEKSSETKAHEQNVQTLIDHGMDGQVLTAEKPSSATKSSNSVNLNEITINNSPGTGLPESFVSTGHTNAPSVGRTSETALLDERSLLACMVRTIPAGGRIRISSTLPNRLGKMLAPLHWHDYKKKYGKLDDFVAAHTELFVIEGDYIQLREGAQEMIAATAAVARVAAAAAAASPYSSCLPSVAVTPVAQTHRLKKISSLDSKNVVTSTPNANNAHLQSVKQNQQLNGVSFGVSGGMSNVKILSKSKDMNGPEPTPSQSSVLLNGGNGAPLDRSMANGRPSSNFVGKQHGRMTNSAFTSRR